MAQYIQYLPTAAVGFMQRFPRFSHGSDFAKLASSERDEQVDYIVGIITASYSIISLFVFWGVVIVIFICMGKHRVGLCAGTVTETSDRSASESFRPPSFIWKLRSTFIIIGCCMILLCAALAGPGMTSIMTASKSVRNANISVQDLIADGLAILDSVDRVKRNIEPLDVSSMMNIEAVCPTFQTNLFLPVDSLKSTIMSADYEFNELKTLLQLTDIEAIRETIDTIWNATEQMDMATNIIGDHDWIVKIFALFLGGLTFFMILRTVAALSCQHKYRPMTALTEIFVLPLFVEAMIIAWVATSVIAIVSIPTAGNQHQSGPTGAVMSIFEERGIASDDMLFVAFQYYQSGCVTEDPVTSLYQYNDDLQSGISLATSMLNTLNGIGVDNINRLCGGDVSSIVVGMELINDNLSALLDALSSFFELASCSKLGPLYSEVLEGTICANSAESSTLLFLIMFAVSIVGMILVMLRAAMYPFREIVDFSNKFAPVDGCDKDGSSTKASAYDASIESNNQSESAPIDI